MLSDQKNGQMNLFVKQNARVIIDGIESLIKKNCEVSRCFMDWIIKLIATYICVH